MSAWIYKLKDCGGDDEIVLCGTCAKVVGRDRDTGNLRSVGFTFEIRGEGQETEPCEDELCDGCGEEI